MSLATEYLLRPKGRDFPSMATHLFLFIKILGMSPLSPSMRPCGGHQGSSMGAEQESIRRFAACLADVSSHTTLIKKKKCLVLRLFIM
jgi:hypothetical protein